MTAVISKIIAFFMSLLTMLFPFLFPKNNNSEIGCLAEDKYLYVTLASNATTGCTWTYTTEGDTEALVFTEKQYIASESKGLVGVGGKDRFTFTAGSAGNITIIFVYGQHWENRKLFEKYTVNCTVDANGAITVNSAVTETLE